MTIAAALGVGIMRLRSAQATPDVRASAAVDAQILLGEILDVDRAWMISHGAEELDADLLDVFGLLLGERMRGVPLAYLTRECEFYGRRFYVDERVLVPRPETEHLLEAALDDLRARSGTGEGFRVLDAGTGSGILALTLAAELPHLQVTATDVSEDALAVARRNAGLLGVEARVTFLLRDAGANVFGTYDCIVANLPYVPSGDVPLPPNPAGFEPRVALDGGSDGLHVYRRLGEHLARLAAPAASMFFEAAPPTIPGLVTIVEYAAGGVAVRVGKDYAGLERFVAVRSA